MSVGDIRATTDSHDDDDDARRSRTARSPFFSRARPLERTPVLCEHHTTHLVSFILTHQSRHTSPLDKLLGFGDVDVPDDVTRLVVSSHARSTDVPRSRLARATPRRARAFPIAPLLSARRALSRARASSSTHSSRAAPREDRGRPPREASVRVTRVDRKGARERATNPVLDASIRYARDVRERATGRARVGARGRCARRAGRRTPGEQRRRRRDDDDDDGGARGVRREWTRCVYERARMDGGARCGRGGDDALGGKGAKDAARGGDGGG